VVILENFDAQETSCQGAKAVVSSLWLEYVGIGEWEAGVLEMVENRGKELELVLTREESTEVFMPESGMLSTLGSRS
jgi:hypothetical protein